MGSGVGLTLRLTISVTNEAGENGRHRRSGPDPRKVCFYVPCIDDVEPTLDPPSRVSECA